MPTFAHAHVNHVDDLHYFFLYAIQRIGEGWSLRDVFSVPEFYGDQCSVEEGLKYGAHFTEDFHEEHREVVQAAFARLGLKVPSWRKDVCAAVLIRELKRRSK